MAFLSPRAIALPALAALVVLLHADAGQPICNVIPHQSVQRFRGALGSADRPFAGPGEAVTLAATPQCGGESFHADPGKGDLTDQYHVLLIFEPPAPYTDERSVVMVAKSCPATVCSGPGIATSRCLAVGTDVLSDVGGSALQVKLPGACSNGAPGTACYYDAQCGSGGTCETNTDRVLAGPLTIAARRVEQPPYCDLAAHDCSWMRKNDSTSAKDFGACIDTLFVDETSCGIGYTDIDVTFPGFTALPPINDFAAMCNKSPSEPSCRQDASDVRFSVDVRGNMWVPMWWNGVVSSGAIPRFLTAGTAFPVTDGGSRPIRLQPDRAKASLAAYTDRGLELPVIFQADLATGQPNELQLRGTADAERSVLRIGRRPDEGNVEVGYAKCSGLCSDGEACWSGVRCAGLLSGCDSGPRCIQSGAACKNDQACDTSAGDECGVGAFAATSRMKDRTGPVPVARHPADAKVCNGGRDDGHACNDAHTCRDGADCVGYRADALWSIDFFHSISTDALRVMVLSEIAVDEDLDGDANHAKTSKRVAVVYDRFTSQRLTIGHQGAPGRAVQMQTRPAGTHFEFPIIAASGGVLALVEDCARHKETCDGDVRPRLRVYALGGNQMHELTTAAIHPALDGVIDGTPLAVTPSGKVLYRATGSGAATALFAFDAAAAPPHPREIGPADQVALDVDSDPQHERVVLVGPTVRSIDLKQPGATLQDLGCQATRVAVRDRWIAAAVGGVLFVVPADATSTSCSSWTNTGEATTESIAVARDAIPFLAPGGAMKVAFVGASPHTDDLGFAADDFQLGTADAVCSSVSRKRVLAARTGSPGAQQLRLYDVFDASQSPVAQATVGHDVRPCNEMQCDPRRPYAVDANLVRACAQCANGTGRCIELYDVCRGDPSTSSASIPESRLDLSTAFLEVPRAMAIGGRCVEDVRKPCATDAECDPGATCLPTSAESAARSCFADRGWCAVKEGRPVAADCPVTAECRPSGSLAWDPEAIARAIEKASEAKSGERP